MTANKRSSSAARTAYVTRDLFDERTKWIVDEVKILLDAFGVRIDGNLAEMNKKVDRLDTEGSIALERVKEKVDHHGGWLNAVKVIGAVLIPLVAWVGVQFFYHVTEDTSKFQHIEKHFLDEEKP